MTNEEKAKELYKKWCDWDSPEDVQTCLLQMAKWKDEQITRIFNFVNPYLTEEARKELKIIIGLNENTTFSNNQYKFETTVKPENYQK